MKLEKNNYFNLFNLKIEIMLTLISITDLKLFGCLECCLSTYLFVRSNNPFDF